MTWEYWICLYTRTHCTARGLRASTIAAYQKTLEQFREYVRLRQGDVEPGQVTARHVLEYVNYLRQERHNGDAAVNRQVTVLKNFYRAIVAMGHLEPAANPLRALPEDEGQAAQAARRVVGRGSPESAGQSTEGYCSGLARSGDPGVVIRHGDPRLGVRDVDGGERQLGGQHGSRVRQGRAREGCSLKSESRRVVAGVSRGARRRVAA